MFKLGLRIILITGILVLPVSLAGAPIPELTFPSTPPLTPVYTGSGPPLWAPSYDLAPSDLVVLINDNDPQSKLVADHYMKAYGLNQEANSLSVRIPVENDLSLQDLQLVVDKLKTLPPTVHAIAISWTRPYRVLKSSITSALVFPEFVKKYGEENIYSDKEALLSGGKTAEKPFYLENSEFFSSIWGVSRRAELEGGFIRRPAMMLAGRNVEDVKALIARGKASRTLPIRSKRSVAGFVLTNSKKRREPREGDFSRIRNDANWREAGITLKFKNAMATVSSDKYPNELIDQERLSYYFTGTSQLHALKTNTFEPGAVVDNLTSYGGMLFDSHNQVTALDFLEAGATGSYGTIAEPTNHFCRFSRASTFIEAYYRGATLIQAYWSSVIDPMMGLFVGDPLARPWGTRARYDEENRTLTVTTTSLLPSHRYHVWEHDSQTRKKRKMGEEIRPEGASVITIEFPVSNGAAYSIEPSQPYGN